MLPSVKQAEKKVVDSALDKEYAGITGVPKFTKAALELAYGSDSAPLAEDRIAVTQTISGTGALRIGGAFLERHSVRGLVVGLPLNMDGTDSPRTQSTRAFARNLAPLELPLLLWDERWSTQAVERAMIAADVSRARRAEAVDKLAAAHILQGALDALCMLPRDG